MGGVVVLDFSVWNAAEFLCVDRKTNGRKRTSTNSCMEGGVSTGVESESLQ